MQISLKKIGIAIIGIIILFHLREILAAVGAVFRWFGDRLAFIDNFPDDAQATIAFCTIILIVVIVLKAMKKM